MSENIQSNLKKTQKQAQNLSLNTSINSKMSPEDQAFKTPQNKPLSKNQSEEKILKSKSSSRSIKSRAAEPILSMTDRKMIHILRCSACRIKFEATAERKTFPYLKQSKKSYPKINGKYNSRRTSEFSLTETNEYSPNKASKFNNNKITPIDEDHINTLHSESANSDIPTGHNFDKVSSLNVSDGNLDILDSQMSQNTPQDTKNTTSSAINKNALYNSEFLTAEPDSASLSLQKLIASDDFDEDHILDEDFDLLLSQQLLDSINYGANAESMDDNYDNDTTKDSPSNNTTSENSLLPIKTPESSLDNQQNNKNNFQETPTKVKKEGLNSHHSPFKHKDLKTSIEQALLLKLQETQAAYEEKVLQNKNLLNTIEKVNKDKSLAKSDDTVSDYDLDPNVINELENFNYQKDQALFSFDKFKTDYNELIFSSNQPNNFTSNSNNSENSVIFQSARKARTRRKTNNSEFHNSGSTPNPNFFANLSISTTNEKAPNTPNSIHSIFSRGSLLQSANSTKSNWDQIDIINKLTSATELGNELISLVKYIESDISNRDNASNDLVMQYQNQLRDRDNEIKRLKRDNKHKDIFDEQIYILQSENENLKIQIKENNILLNKLENEKNKLNLSLSNSKSKIESLENNHDELQSNFEKQKIKYENEIFAIKKHIDTAKTANYEIENSYTEQIQDINFKLSQVLGTKIDGSPLKSRKGGKKLNTIEKKNSNNNFKNLTNNLIQKVETIHNIIEENNQIKQKYNDLSAENKNEKIKYDNLSKMMVSLNNDTSTSLIKKFKCNEEDHYNIENNKHHILSNASPHSRFKDYYSDQSIDDYNLKKKLFLIEKNKAATFKHDSTINPNATQLTSNIFAKKFNIKSYSESLEDAVYDLGSDNESDDNYIKRYSLKQKKIQNKIKSPFITHKISKSSFATANLSNKSKYKTQASRNSGIHDLASELQKAEKNKVRKTLPSIELANYVNNSEYDLPSSQFFKQNSENQPIINFSDNGQSTIIKDIYNTTDTVNTSKIIPNLTGSSKVLLSTDDAIYDNHTVPDLTLLETNENNGSRSLSKIDTQNNSAKEKIHDIEVTNRTDMSSLNGRKLMVAASLDSTNFAQKNNSLNNIINPTLNLADKKSEIKSKAGSTQTDSKQKVSVTEASGSTQTDSKQKVSVTEALIQTEKEIGIKTKAGSTQTDSKQKVAVTEAFTQSTEQKQPNTVCDISVQTPLELLENLLHNISCNNDKPKISYADIPSNLQNRGLSSTNLTFNSHDKESSTNLIISQDKNIQNQKNNSQGDHLTHINNNNIYKSNQAFHTLHYSKTHINHSNSASLEYIHAETPYIAADLMENSTNIQTNLNNVSNTTTDNNTHVNDSYTLNSKTRPINSKNSSVNRRNINSLNSDDEKNDISIKTTDTDLDLFSKTNDIESLEKLQKSSLQSLKSLKSVVKSSPRKSAKLYKKSTKDSRSIQYSKDALHTQEHKIVKNRKPSKDTRVISLPAQYTENSGKYNTELHENNIRTLIHSKSLPNKFIHSNLKSYCEDFDPSQPNASLKKKVVTNTSIDSLLDKNFTEKPDLIFDSNKNIILASKNNSLENGENIYPSIPDKLGIPDPFIVQAVARTMVGSYMYKFSAKSSINFIKTDLNTCLRYFWVHPYTKVLSWSKTPPAADKSKTVAKNTNPISSFADIWRSNKNREIYINKVFCINDYKNDNYFEDLISCSIVVSSKNESIRIKATSLDEHNQWLLALSYLQTREGIVGESSKMKLAPNKNARISQNSVLSQTIDDKKNLSNVSQSGISITNSDSILSARTSYTENNGLTPTEFNSNRIITSNTYMGESSRLKMIDRKNVSQSAIMATTNEKRTSKYRKSSAYDISMYKFINYDNSYNNKLHTKESATNPIKQSKSLSKALPNDYLNNNKSKENLKESKKRTISVKSVTKKSISSLIKGSNSIFSIKNNSK
ncbi:hypothetical protein BB561_006873, partial [Smittium simulii]